VVELLFGKNQKVDYAQLIKVYAKTAATPGRYSPAGIVRANSFTLPKRQNRISRPLIFLHFSGSI